MLALIVALLVQNVEGDWHGAIDAGGQKVRLSIHVKKNADGSLKGTMDSLDQGAKGIPLDSVTFRDGEFAFELKMADGSYTGRLAGDPPKITGTWKQGGHEAPLELTRTPHVPPKRPQTPVKPYPYAEEEVTFENAAAKIRLAGTLTLPRGAGPHPAVALITGSGPQDRDEALLDHRLFLVLADHLTRAGIAVLRYDDRGVGKSTGHYARATSADFATDADAAVAFLRSRKDIDPARVGLVGHSEGGLIAPMCAARSKDVAFIALLAGPGTTGERILIAQTEAILRASGVPEEKIAEQTAASKRGFAIMREEKDDAVARRKMEALVRETEPELGDDELKMRIDLVFSPWMRAFIASDPAPALRKVTCPVLAINGEKDLQVPCRENLDGIAAALKEGGNTKARVVALPGLNHLFQTCTTGAPGEYGEIEETFAPVALETISKWILEVTKR